MSKMVSLQNIKSNSPITQMKSNICLILGLQRKLVPDPHQINSLKGNIRERFWSEMVM